MTVSSDRINKLLHLIGGSSYLEVGVQEGKTFHQVDATTKVAVDPKFLFDVHKAREGNSACAYHEVTSDRYFQGLSGSDSFDLIFLDGLHRYEQTYRDFCNATHALSGLKSIIIVDDTFPTDVFSSHRDNAMALKHRSEYGNAGPGWHGDVYKSMLLIAAFHPMYEYFTITGKGQKSQTVLWRAPDSSRLHAPRSSEFDAFISNIALFDYLWLLDNIHVLNPVQTFADGLALIALPD